MERAAAQRTVPRPVPGLEGVTRWPEFGSERKPFVGLDRNERVMDLPDWFVEEVRSELTSEVMVQYPATDLLYEALGERLGLERERLLLVPGSDGGLRNLFQAYIGPGDATAMLDPTYAMYPVYTELAGGRSIKVGYDAERRLDREELLAAVAEAKVAVLANPNHTGTVLDAETVEAVLARAADAGTLVVFDEAYVAFAPEGTSVLDRVREVPNLLVSHTWSKAPGIAGLRFGAMVGDPEVITNLAKVRSANDISSFTTLVASKLLEHPEIGEAYVAAIEEGRRTLNDAASALGMEPLECVGNFQIIRVAEGIDPEAIVAAAKERGYLIKTGGAAPSMAGCIRVTLAAPKVIEGFVAILPEAVSTGT